MKQYLLYTGFFLTFTPLFAFAQSPCGDFVVSELYEGEIYEERTPIQDCDNPFGADDPTPYTPQLRIDGKSIETGMTISVTEGVEVTIDGEVPLPYEYISPNLSLYIASGTDYYFVRETSGRTPLSFTKALAPGDYTAIFSRSPRPELVGQRTWYERMLAFFQPAITQAFYVVETDEVVTVTFTVTHEPEVVGNSSVLFLPGIQASRLYKNNIFGSGTDQVWPPNALFNEDIYDLAMSSEGVSEKALFTKDIIDTTTGAGDIYANLIGFLDELKTDGTIHNWQPYAYDWRYSVTDIARDGTQYRDSVKDAIAEIERLATDSFSDKVTIIGHSNGGLLAKAIMRRLEAEGKEGFIDKVVLLASPQLGTPKAIGTILHGYDQTDAYGGFIMNASDVRKVSVNLPAVYGLLPTEKYFDGLDTSLVLFTDSAVTAPYRQMYGATITSFDTYVRFLRGEDGFGRDTDGPISKPSRANAAMLDAALAMHRDLDSWTAPAGVEVIEIVGTGLPTMKAVQYREIREDKCVYSGGQPICTTESEIKPYAVLTKYGDSTVVQRSAEGYGGDKKKYFLNLAEIRKNILLRKIEHYNITEAPPVQKLLKEIITNTPPEENQFVSSSYTEFADEYDVEMIDSPVRILATDSAGNETGVVIENGVRVIKQEIPNSQYFEFGDTRYLIVPKGTNRTTRLYGEDYGGYTLTTARIGSDDTQTVQTTLPNASTTPDMEAVYTNIDSVFSTVKTDLNGDGAVDLETTLGGEVVAPPQLVSYETLIATVEGLQLSKPRKQVLLLSIRNAQHFGTKIPARPIFRKLEDTFLTAAQELVRTYERRRQLSSTEATQLQGMIKALKDKQ